MKVKKVVAFFLASTMVLSMIPAMAFAADKTDSNVEGLDFAKALADGTYMYGKPGEGYDWVTADCYEVKEVQYCTDPVSELQYMNIWVPAEYVNDDGSINTEAVVNGYTAETAAHYLP